MEIGYTAADLLAFEEEIAAEFAAGKIRAPVHLSGGQEQALIDIFAGIAPDDWVFCGWRSHYHCLLKGVPRYELKQAILNGASVALTFPEYKVFCSGICGGIAPIATGVGWACKARNDLDYTGNEQRVHVFLGDMSARMGIVYEAVNYADGHQLPVNWYIEDNGLSVMTDTTECWGSEADMGWGMSYKYKLTRPHAGIGQWVKL